MNNQVLKTEDLLKKNWQRKTYPLKLNLTDLQKARLENITFEYKKAINKIIEIVLNDFYKNYLIQIPEEEHLKDICPLCSKEKKLTHKLLDFEFVKYAESKGKANYKPVFKKGNEVLICEGCHCSHYSLRKFLLPSSRRELPIPQWDFTKKVNLGKRTSIYDSCLQKAVETIRSQVSIKRKIVYQIKWHQERIIENKKLLDKEISKVKRDENEIKKLTNYIKHSEKAIPKLEKSKSQKIEYKADSIRLYNNSYDLIEEEGDFFIRFKNYQKDEWMTLMFYGKNYQKNLAKKFIKSKKAETEIIRKGDNYYLQYIYRQEIEVPIPDETFTAVGIDVNIINLACYVSMKKDLKPMSVKFFSGRRLRDKRRRFAELRKIWNSKRKYTEKGGKGKSKKWFDDKCKSQREQDYIKYTIHNLTTQIVQEIKEKVEKPVIVLENLKDIRSKTDRTIKISKTTLENYKKNQKRFIKEFRKLTLELNNWNFADFQKFIEYKANWLGIPVVYVSAKDTSIKCNKCGYIGKDIYDKIEKRKTLRNNENIENFHELKFKCAKCGYRCNADYNAGYNIAKQFFNLDK